MVQQYTLATARSADYLYTSTVAADDHPDIPSSQQILSSVCKHAILKKVKTNKYKFFVLHKDSSTAPARLEYYDTESQWIKKKKAKRTIYLRTCFSINAFSDTKSKFGMTIFTKDDSFQIGFESEQDRDMWLADMRLLSHSSHQSRSIVQHMWNVTAHTRNMKSPIEGEFKLCLNEHQATLICKKNPDEVLELPLTVIAQCTHNDKFFGFELRAEADTGAGEIWVKLEDSLIAQHVHRAFQQNLSLISPGDDSFRPASRSFSSKDRKSSHGLRLRSGSDARRRNRIGQSLAWISQYSSMVMSSSGRAQGSTGSSRERSDSIDSHSTAASLSTDESDFTRSVTPDIRMDLPAYLPMNFSNKSATDENCRCVSSTDYTDMSGHHRSHDRNSNFMYMDMSCSSHHTAYTDMSGRTSGYIDMTMGNISPKYSGYKLKPQPVKCYLIEDQPNGSPEPTRSDTHSRSQASPASKNGEYVEMRRQTVLSDKDKSSSAPHLQPLTPCQQQDQFTDMRDRTSSMTGSHRPRGASWSQSIRPRSSTTDQKHKLSLCNRSSSGVSNLKPLGTDYMDMTCGRPSTDSYVDMCLRHRDSHPLSNAITEREDKENMYRYDSPSPRSSRVGHVDPFPELSASSDDDVSSLQSNEGSISLQSLTSNSLTSSADSMSTSSHSSHYSQRVSGGTYTSSSLDMEPYVAMQPAPISYVQSISHSHRMLPKPTEVTSYILDDTHEQKADDRPSEYMDMLPSASSSRHTKQ